MRALRSRLLLFLPREALHSGRHELRYECRAPCRLALLRSSLLASYRAKRVRLVYYHRPSSHLRRCSQLLRIGHLKKTKTLKMCNGSQLMSTLMMRSSGEAVVRKGVMTLVVRSALRV